MAGETPRVGGSTAAPITILPPAEVRSESSTAGSSGWAVAAGGFLAATALALLFRGRGRARVEGEMEVRPRLWEVPFGRLPGLVPERIPVRPVLPGGVNPFTALRTAGVTAGTATVVAGCGDESGTAGRDAGVDRGSDGGRDAGYDAGQDAGHDAVGDAGQGANHPPSLSPIANQAVQEGEHLSFTVSASDPDGQAVTISTGPLPSGATFNPATRTFNWTPGFTQAGNYSVSFHASDGSADVTRTVNITVTDVVVEIGGAEFLINSAPTGAGRLPDASMAADGSAMVVWSDGGNVRGRVIDSSGGALSGEITIASLGSSVGSPQVSLHRDGYYVVAWAVPNTGSGGSLTSDVYARRYDLSGAPLTEAMLVRSVPRLYDEGDSFDDRTFSLVSPNSDTNYDFFFSWTVDVDPSLGPDDAVRGLFGVFTDDGLWTDADFLINGGVASDHPKIAIDSTGNSYVSTLTLDPYGPFGWGNHWYVFTGIYGSTGSHLSVANESPTFFHAPEEQSTIASVDETRHAVVWGWASDSRGGWISDLGTGATGVSFLHDFARPDGFLWSGGLMVVGEDHSSPGTPISGRYFDMSAVPKSSAFTISGSSGVNPRATGNASGRVLTVWGTPGASGVYGREMILH